MDLQIENSNSIATYSLQACNLKEKTLNYLAFSTQFSQLSAIENYNQELGKFKRASLIKHINTLSDYEKLSIAFRLFIKKINIIRTLVMRILHPPSFTMTFNKIKNYTNENYSNNYSENLPKDFVENANNSNHGAYFNFYNEDHELLDGFIMYGTTKENASDLPVVILALPRHIIYEFQIREAREIARKNNVNVVLYNSRGTGLSLGKEYSTDDGIEDCRAVIDYTLKNFCNQNPNKIGLIGYSWGGGISAGALKKFHDQTKNKIGLYINLRSFSSLNNFFQWTILKKISQIFFFVMRINPLNTGELLKNEQFAKKTVVMKIGGDNLMKGDFCLSNYLNYNSQSEIHFYEEKHWRTRHSNGVIEEILGGHNHEWDYLAIGQKIEESIKKF